MITKPEEKVLEETVVLLIDENKPDSLNIVLKMMAERTLALLNKPTDFLDDLPFTLPSIKSFQSFNRLDLKIRRFIRNREFHKAHELLVDYIDLLPNFVSHNDKEATRKFILANILEKSSPIEEKQNVYTSSEAAEILGVSDQTIRRWCEKGKYPDAFQTPGGHWRIPKKYFKIGIEEARKRREFEQQLNEFNASKGEADESEWL